jgi:bifunctional non-homologous end joining protein LigD
LAKIPFRVSPMLATLVDQPFTRPNWIFEEKYDGVRMLSYKEGAQVSLISRNGIDRTERYPEIAAAVGKLKPDTLVLDGEVVVFDKKGVSHFQLLQQGKGTAAYAIFDCLYCDGKDLRNEPLSARRSMLGKFSSIDHPLLLSANVSNDGQKADQIARKRGLEGVVGKDLRSPYVSRRSGAWLKVKIHQEQEFVIAGYTKPSGSRIDFGALLLGVYGGKGLEYVGKVGTGFDEDTLRKLYLKMRMIRQQKSPFVETLRERDVTFVKPRLIAQISFTEWTNDGKLRHPVYLGLRDDKIPKEVRRES